MFANDLSSPHSEAALREASGGGYIFAGASVVQLVAGDPGGIDAHVMTLKPARIRLAADRIVATTESSEWSWLFVDIQRVIHGADEPWTILEVPSVPDMGVSVRTDDLDAFRTLLWKALPHATHLQRSAPRRSPVAGPPPSIPIPPSAPSPSAPTAPHVYAVPTPPPEPSTIHDDDTVVTPASWFAPPPASPDQVQSPSAAMTRVAHVEPRPNDVEPAPSAKPSANASLAGLEARSISAWFANHQVLDRVSLHMAPGKVTALIGPSGCGKSTFLRILNRMHEMIPSASLAGEVLLDGADIYDTSRRLTDARRQIGMVFQKPNPFPTMSIYDNVVAGFRLTGTKRSASEKDEVVESCLSKAGLWNEVKDRLRRPGGSLSGGQQQRLCIARALAIKPRVLLMDEPCSALDPTSTRRIEQTIIELAEEVTIVIVTHNMQQAARVSDHCAFFLAEHGTPGVIVEHGPTEAMFHTPQDPRTNDYVNGRFG